MKPELKIFLSIVGVFILLAVVGLAYLFRPQSIDTAMIPNEFNYCGKVIWGKDKEYLNIVKWIEDNRDGWTQNWHTHYAGQGYHYPAFQVTIFPDFVAISYKTDWGYPQYTKSFTHDLVINCESES
ncbi:hypothetical protein [Aliikangiella sp. IMCC44632]